MFQFVPDVSAFSQRCLRRLTNFVSVVSQHFFKIVHTRYFRNFSAIFKKQNESIQLSRGQAIKKGDVSANNSIFFARRTDGWYLGKSHMSRNQRQIYLKTSQESDCANFLDPQFWKMYKDESEFPINITCSEE